MSEIKINVLHHNTFFDCYNCGEKFNLKNETAYAVLKLIAVKPQQGSKDKFDHVCQTVFVDAECFKDLEFVEQEPAEIVKNG